MLTDFYNEMVKKFPDMKRISIAKSLKRENVYVVEIEYDEFTNEINFYTGDTFELIII